MRIKYIRVKSALSRSGLKEIDYALNPYLGCYHSCIYCYARDFTRYEEVAKNWGEVIYVKINLLDVLRREVKRLPKGVVGVATITDPYQPIEATYRLTRGSLEILKRYGFKVSIQTKSPLVLRDKDIIEPKQFDVGVTIITMDKDVAKVVEPKAPPPTDRVRILKEISELGVETWLFMGPIIPCLTDNLEDIKEVLIVAKEANTPVYYDKLNMKPLMSKHFIKTLSKEGFNIKEILSKVRNEKYWKELFSKVEELCEDVGVKCYLAYPYSFTKLVRN